MHHHTATISKEAEIEGFIGAYSIIEGKVIIGKNTIIKEFVKIKCNTIIGKNCKIYENVSIGNPPQDIKYKGEPTYVKIGNNNIIREFVTIHGGVNEGTIIGDNNFLMSYVHIAHNCKIGNGVIIANATQIAGYVEIEDYAFISGLCPIHQFVRIGRYSMIGGGYRVPQDVLPYSLVVGDPLKVHGLNIVGLNRHNFSKEKIKILKEAFKILMSNKYNLSQAINIIENNLKKIEEIKHIIEFIKNTKRGIAI